jgi:simple sugar transport system permease protein
MTAGRGWIAVVAVMLGRSNPLYAAAACVLFGFADAFSVNLQSRGLPNQLTDIAPYVVTLLALAISHRRRRAQRSREVALATPGGAAEAEAEVGAEGR